MSSKVLALGAHFDDAELGCGGALARHARKGDKVTLWVATRSGFADRTDDAAGREGRKAAKILGVDLVEGDRETFSLAYEDGLVRELRALVDRLRPGTVYLPFTGDAHQDHRALARAALSAARHCPRLLMYRINWYDTEEAFIPRHFIDITKTMPVKLRALRAHASEMKRTGGRWLEWVTQRDRQDGIRLGVGYAEAFQAVRYLEP
ncbi:MAG: PIG-L family deacetylase [Elusimicrobia bacterium]|nr:PIG-L family deacetylase [Elusimicrobiota bacterium]